MSTQIYALFWKSNARAAIYLLAALWTVPCAAQAGRTTGMGFYNVENLFDTVPNPLIRDADYTPEGRLRWNTGRYTRKIANLARVVDDLSLDVLALAEVENEAVVRDLVLAAKTDYNYIHRTMDDARGIDLALLYKGDRFEPERVRLVASGFGRQFLYVRGRLCGVRVDVVVCHLPSLLNRREMRARTLDRLCGFVDSLQRSDAGARVVVLGDFNANPDDPLMRERFPRGVRVAADAGMLCNPLYAKWKDGQGSYVYRDRRELLDHIYLGGNLMNPGGGLRYRSCGIFVREYLLVPAGRPDHGYPLRTFASGRYDGGFSDHLPVFVYLDVVSENLSEQ